MGWEGPCSDASHTECKPFLRHRLHYHACCWMLRAMVFIPAAAWLMHLLGIPHPEGIHLIP